MDEKNSTNSEMNVILESAEAKKAEAEKTKEEKHNKDMKVLVVLAVILLFANCAITSAALICSVKAAKGYDALKEEKEEENTTKEDGVIIAEEYEIASTVKVSDAYKSGDSEQLTDYEKETLLMASDILDEIIEEDMSDYEKEQAVYDWMCENISDDEGMLAVIPTADTSVDTPHGVLSGRNAVCVGYATTFRLFMQMLDIDCHVIHNIEAYHSWNLVELDDEWYHVDIYSDSYSGNYAHFNLTDSMIGQEWDESAFPAATGIKYNYYYQNMKQAENIYEVPQLFRDAMSAHEGGIYIEFGRELSISEQTVLETAIASIDNHLMDENDGSISAPYSIDSYSFYDFGDGSVLCVGFGSYPDDYDYSGEYVDFGEYEEDLDKALEDAFGDWFDEISLNDFYDEDWDEDYDEDWDEDNTWWSDEDNTWKDDAEGDAVQDGDAWYEDASDSDAISHISHIFMQEIQR